MSGSQQVKEIALSVARSAGQREDLREIQNETSRLAKELGKRELSALHQDVHKRIVERVEKIAATNARLELEANQFSRVMGELAQEIGSRPALRDEDVDQTEIEDYTAIIMARMKEALSRADENLKDSKTYKDTMKVVRDDESEELEVVGEGGSSSHLKCPFTHSVFVEPVKSRRCGHTFERKAVQQHLHISGSNAVCPVAGCSNKLTREDIVRDKEMEREVKINQQVESQTQAMQSTLDLDDEDVGGVTYL